MGISDTNDIARALIDEYADDRRTKAGVKRPPPFDKRRDSVNGGDVVRIVTERFAHLAYTEEILAC